MKARPYIDPSERDTILRQLRKNGKWTTRRAAGRVRFWTRQTPDGLRVCYQCFPKHRTSVVGCSITVSGAIEGCNAALTPVSFSGEAQEHTQTFPAPPKAQWLPYADN